MSTVFTIVGIAAVILSFTALMLGIKRDLMMLQQNSNRNDRYRRWMKENGESTRASRLIAMLIAMMFAVRFIPSILPMSLAVLVCLFDIYSLATAHYKKPLVFTKRIIRIYIVAVVLLLLLTAILTILWSDRLYMLLIMPVFCFMAGFSVSYLFVLSANWMLKPVEKRINKKYYDEAASILASMPDLKVIGITGSYGKTSTKHYLYRILSEQFDTLMTPGNFNTTLGVIRTIREQMKPYNRIFIAEMGAKQKGDIKEICDLVHPEIGIITAVGPQHLESFKTIENVQSTKFELADCIPPEGTVVINDDFEYIANRPVDNAVSVRYAVDNTKNAGYRATNIEYTPSGTKFTIEGPEGYKLQLQTHLVGKCNISNLMAAVIVARHLGVGEDKIRYAVSKIEQVEHRLNMKRTASGITIIDDAYNSNPVGSAMALEVLSGMSAGKRIVITPGMIELGDEQYEQNRQLGENIAKSADIAIIVGSYNRDAIVEGIKQGGMSEEKIKIADTFAEAQQMMLGIAEAGDTVLYENDLPDTFK